MTGFSGSVTVTAQVAEVSPSLAVQVMVALPALTAVTKPSLTVATLVSLEVQMTV